MKNGDSTQSESRSVRLFLAIAAGLFLVAFILAPRLRAQGNLTPPGAPAPLFRTLTQVEPRTPISSLPFTITAAGSYYFTTNLTGVAGSNGIVVGADNVTLDLRGFALTGVASSLNGIITSNQNLAVRDGTIRNWGSNGLQAVRARNSLFERLRVSNNQGNGLQAGPASVVTACVAFSNTLDGFQTGDGCVVRDCTASVNQRSGIVIGEKCLLVHSVAASNDVHGIVAVGGCVVLENLSVANGASGTTNAAGIFVAGVGGARIEGNNLFTNLTMGIRLLGGGNLVIRNSARMHATNYVIPAGNAFGPTNAVSGVITNTNPWLNFSF
jgi:parallel beta-helix repeat protein